MSLARSAEPAPPFWDDKPMWFRHIFDHDAPFVWRTLLGLGVPEKDVEDASQQVFVVLHRKLDALSPTVAIRTYLYGICIRVASEFRRRVCVHRELLLDELPDQATTPTQEASALNREALEKLQHVLDGLDDSKREVFVLYEIEGLEMPEIAEAIGCPLQTAYSRLHAARKAVLEAYNQHKPRAARGRQ